MSMPPPFLLVKNQGAGLVFERGKLRLDGVPCRLEILDGGVVAFRRIETDGKKRLLALRPCGGDFDLKERARKVV